jgi:hypothetical protein
MRFFAGQSNRIPKKMGAFWIFKTDSKANFIRFVEKNAILEDLSLIVDTLKSLRYYLGLPPDGETISNTLMRE